MKEFSEHFGWVELYDSSLCTFYIAKTAKPFNIFPIILFAKLKRYMLRMQQQKIDVCKKKSAIRQNWESSILVGGSPLSPLLCLQGKTAN